MLHKAMRCVASYSCLHALGLNRNRRVHHCMIRPSFIEDPFACKLGTSTILETQYIYVYIHIHVYIYEGKTIISWDHQAGGYMKLSQQDPQLKNCMV